MATVKLTFRGREVEVSQQAMEMILEAADGNLANMAADSERVVAATTTEIETGLAISGGGVNWG